MWHLQARQYNHRPRGRLRALVPTHQFVLPPPPGPKKNRGPFPILRMLNNAVNGLATPSADRTKFGYAEIGRLAGDVMSQT